MNTYTARAVRSGNWWAIDVPELDGVFSQARRLDQVEYMARDAIALTLDVAPDSFDVAVEPVLPDELQMLVKELRYAREAAADAADRAAHITREVVEVLHDQAGLPMRDIGRIIGVSHQRIGQLTKTPS